MTEEWWAGVDLDHRTIMEQIYSLPRLAASLLAQRSLGYGRETALTMMVDAERFELPTSAV